MGVIVAPYLTNELAKEFKKRMSAPWMVRVASLGSGFQYEIMGLSSLLNSDALADEIFEEVNKRNKSFDIRPLLKKHLKRTISEMEAVGLINSDLKTWNLVRNACGLANISLKKSKKLIFKQLLKSEQNKFNKYLKKQLIKENLELSKQKGSTKNSRPENIVQTIDKILKSESIERPSYSSLESLSKYPFYAEDYNFYLRYAAKKKKSQYIFVCQFKNLKLSKKLIQKIYEEIPQLLLVRQSYLGSSNYGFLIDMNLNDKIKSLKARKVFKPYGNVKSAPAKKPSEYSTKAPSSKKRVPSVIARNIFATFKAANYPDPYNADIKLLKTNEYLKDDYKLKDINYKDAKKKIYLAYVSYLETNIRISKRLIEQILIENTEIKQTVKSRYPGPSIGFIIEI